MPQTYQAKNILITGGAGFIGANYIRYLLTNSNAKKIINLDNLTYCGSLANLPTTIDPKRYQFIKGDINDFNLVKNIFLDQQIDTIVHFAAESHVDRSINAPVIFAQTNVVGTLQLLAAAREVWLNKQGLGPQDCRFIHISTDEVYGSLELTSPPFTETNNYLPNSPYAATKAGSVHLVRAYYQTYGLPTIITHCSNNYGPYQYREKLIPKIIRCCLQELPIPIYADGKNRRDWLFVVDHCAAINLVVAAGTNGATYNIGTGTTVTNIEIVTHICKLLDDYHPRAYKHFELLKFVDDRLGHDFCYAINPHKITTELGWRPQTKLVAGLTKTVEFYVRALQTDPQTIC